MSRFPVILSAPSGGGKTTIAKRLLDGRADLGHAHAEVLADLHRAAGADLGVVDEHIQLFRDLLGQLDDGTMGQCSDLGERHLPFRDLYDERNLQAEDAGKVIGHGVLIDQRRDRTLARLGRCEVLPWQNTREGVCVSLLRL